MEITTALKCFQSAMATHVGTLADHTNLQQAFKSVTDALLAAKVLVVVPTPAPEGAQDANPST